MLFILIYPLFTYYTLGLNDNRYFIFGSILLSLLIYDFIRAAKPIIKWRKSIQKFLTKLEKTEVVTFSYNDQYFIHVQDSDSIKQEWSVVESALISERYIWLFSNINILLPKSAMTEAEYLGLSKMVLEKVKSVKKSES